MTRRKRLCRCCHCKQLILPPDIPMHYVFSDSDDLTGFHSHERCHQEEKKRLTDWQAQQRANTMRKALAAKPSAQQLFDDLRSEDGMFH